MLFNNVRQTIANLAPIPNRPCCRDGSLRSWNRNAAAKSFFIPALSEKQSVLVFVQIHRHIFVAAADRELSVNSERSWDRVNPCLSMFLNIPRWLTASSFMEEDIVMDVVFIKINMVINFFIYRLGKSQWNCLYEIASHALPFSKWSPLSFPPTILPVTVYTPYSERHDEVHR